MTVVKFVPLLCFIGVFFLFLIRCGCLQIQITNSRFNQGVENKEVQVPVEKLLPRKLQVLAVTILENAERDTPSKKYSPDKNIVSDKLKRKKASVAANAKTWQQWKDDGGDSSEYFTMDYSRVRRRRPIHNKSLPVGP